MTYVFEILSNKDTLQAEVQAKPTIQNTHQEVLDYTKHKEKLSSVRPTAQRYFIICQTCFWCTSYVGTMDIMNHLGFVDKIFRKGNENSGCLKVNISPEYKF